MKTLKDASFSLYEGELISLLDLVEAEKVPCFAVSIVWIDNNTGEIQFMGMDVTKADKKKLKKYEKNIGMIFQHYNLVYRLNVFGKCFTWKSWHLTVHGKVH